MDAEKKTDLELIEWIRSRNHSGYEIEETSEENRKVLTLHTSYATGTVRINYLDYVIAEYIIENQEGENVFYLHFELDDIEHAKDLFSEMEECLLKQKTRRKRNVLLCCTCGLTTSFFAMRLNEVAKLLNAEMEFTAVPYEKVFESAESQDAILVAPQIGYKWKSIQEIITDKIVMKIPAAVFSAYDAGAMVQMLVKAFEEAEVSKEEVSKDTEKEHLASDEGSVLILSVIYMEGRNQIAYRLYDHNELVRENQITKETYQLSDITDALRTVTRLNPELRQICIVTPGMIQNGKLTYENVGIADYDLVSKVKEFFEGEVFLYNDADMIALGYAHQHCPDGSCAFYFVPTGNYAGNIGISVNGNLIRGRGNMGGRQLEAVTDITTFPMNPFALQRTPEGNVELAARYLTGLFSYTGIDHIAFYSKMIPNADVLIEKMKTFIPEQYMPEIVRAESVRDYLYAGALASIHTHQ